MLLTACTMAQVPYAHRLRLSAYVAGCYRWKRRSNTYQLVFRKASAYGPPANTVMMYGEEMKAYIKPLALSDEVSEMMTLITAARPLLLFTVSHQAAITTECCPPPTQLR